MGELVKMRERESQKEGLRRLLRTIHEKTGKTLTGIEAGSYAGESAQLMAETGLVDRLFCVDPWKGGWDSKDVASSTDLSEAEAEFDRRMALNPRVVRKFKGTLQEFRAKFPDLKPDFVYIDAEHTYEGCRRDIETALEWRPLAVSGHDYCRGWSGVMKAVDEKFGRPYAVFEDESWLVFPDYDSLQVLGNL